MLDACGVVVIVMIGAQVEMRRRQQRRDHGRRSHEDGSERPAESGSDHARIIYQKTNFVAI